MLLTLLALLSATPAAATAPPQLVTVAQADPAKLAVATRIVARLIPNGSYRKMMGGTFATLTGSMSQQMTSRQVALMAGLPEDKVRTIGPGTIKQVLAIVDPAFDERLRLSTAAITAAMIDQMSAMEPSIRDGMAIAYANHFDAVQLAAIEAFFASPAGTAYAGEALSIMQDPAVMTRMQASMGRMMAAMPGVMKSTAAATASLPPPKKVADLIAGDRAKLAALLGVEPGALK
jgi:hypothetical protein